MSNHAHADAPPRSPRVPAPRAPSDRLPTRQPVGDVFPSALAPSYILSVDPPLASPPAYPPSSPPAYLPPSRGIEHEVTDEATLPTYHATATTEPRTFARTMFKAYNPLCWALGAYTLFVAMRPPAEGEDGYDDFVRATGIREAVEAGLEGVEPGQRGKVRTAMEKQRIDEQVRLIAEAERRWAKYCLYALLASTIGTTLIVLLIVLIVKMTSK